jgi:hypothetical protein
MSRGKEADLLLAFFRYVLRCLAERDFDAVRRLGIRSDQLNVLQQLRLVDVQHVSTSAHRCLDIRLNHDAFARMIDRLAAVRERDALKQALIDADANLPMMRQLFGMSSREYTARRYKSVASRRSGRPRAPSEVEERCVWEAWAARMARRAAPTLSAQDYLALHRATNDVPLRTIWTLCQRWMRDEHCLRLVRRMSTQTTGP